MTGVAPLLALVAALAAGPTPPPAPVRVERPAAPPQTPTEPLSLPREAASALRSLGGRVVGREVRMVLAADALFSPGTAALRAEAAEVLGRVALVIRALPNEPVGVTVHCDSIGSEAAAIALTVRQGQAVADWLRGHGGLGPRWIAVRALGATEPRAADTRADGSFDLAGRRRNRRLEVVVGRN